MTVEDKLHKRQRMIERERENEKEKERDRQRERNRERQRDRTRGSVSKLSSAKIQISVLSLYLDAIVRTLYHGSTF